MILVKYIYSICLIIINIEKCINKPVDDEKESKRIIGGIPTSSNEFPFFALIRIVTYSKNRDGRYYEEFCGGTIIDKYYILTAGHCLNESAVTTVTVGLKYLSEFTDKSMEVEKLIIHPKYETKNVTIENDIGLIKLKHQLQFNEKVKPIDLPREDEEQDFRLVQIAGFGALDRKKNQASEQLMAATIRIVHNNLCKVRWIGYSPFRQVCAGDLSGKKDACLGDSGGPLFGTKQNGQPVLLGITSFGKGCATVGRPAVYTRVSHYVDWIKSVIGEKQEKSKH